MKQHKDGRKQHTCKYCKKKIFKVPRHLEDCHSETTEVARALAFPSGSKERRAAFAKIRREGDYEPSLSRLKEKNHAIAVRQGKQKNELSPCPHCFGFFQPKFLYRHAKYCPANVLSEESNNVGQGLLKSSRSLLATAMTDDSKHQTIIKEIISKMKQDAYTLIMKTDPLLLSYGAVMFEKDGNKRRIEISYKLKCVARLLEVFQEQSKSEHSTAFDLIDPKNWDTLVESAKTLTKYNSTEIGIPSLFLKLGYSLQHMARVARAMGIKREDDALTKKCQGFLDLYESEWIIYTTRVRIQFDDKRGKTPQELPLAADIKSLRNFCQEEIKKYLDKGIASKMEWRWLAEVTLCRITTFNARRGGEPSTLTLDHWKDAEDDKWKKPESLSLLSEAEKQLANRLKVLYILGKRRRQVPILFTEETIAAIRLLIATRSNADISADNKYIFARQQESINHISGWVAVKAVASKASLSKPQLMTSTRIRKELATTLQLLDMKESELLFVTNHLGHSINVHKQWYRQEESTMELTKVARVLMAKDDGIDFKNKKMDELGEPAGGECFSVTDACKCPKGFKYLDVADLYVFLHTIDIT